MQADMFGAVPGTDWDVLEVRVLERIGKPDLVLYAHTRPKNWVGPEASDKLPWES